jgi:hypothetical protein
MTGATLQASANSSQRPLSVALSTTRQLAVAVQFVDGFTGQPIFNKYSVSIETFPGVAPKLLQSLADGWAGAWSGSDATYRFSLTNLPPPAQLPGGTFNLVVTNPGGAPVYANPLPASPSGPYAASAPLKVTIPPVAPHAPPVLASDYLVALPLWPTVAFSVPNGETAVSGWVVSKASGTPQVGFGVTFASAGAAAGAAPQAVTDGSGQFLYRLPNLARPAGPNPQVTLNITMVDQNGAAVAVTPPNLTVSAGILTSSVVLTVP